METNELKKKLDDIRKKREKCIPLTKAEEKIVDEFLNKLYTTKFGDKRLVVQTGDEIRKANFEGAYGRIAGSDVERTAVSRDGKNTAEEPTRKDTEYFSEEGKQTPTENTEGTPYGDYRTEEYADADNKKYVPDYEEEKLADKTEGQHQYQNSIRVHDIVVKTFNNGLKLVGHVTGVYKNSAVMVKWSNKTVSHELISDLEVLKLHSKTTKEEQEKVSPPVEKFSFLPNPKTNTKPRGPLDLPTGGKISVKPGGRLELPKGRGYIESTKPRKVAKRRVAVPVAALHRARMHRAAPAGTYKSADVEKGAVGAGIRAVRAIGRKVGQKVGPAVAERAGYISGRAKPGSVTRRIADVVSGRAVRHTPGAGSKLRAFGRGLRGEVSGMRHTTQRAKLGKGEKPPSEWLDRCVEKLKNKGDVDEPYAVCTATYNKMKSLSPTDLQKDKSGNEFIKLTAEDFDGSCQSCADKMRKQNIKFLKVYIGNLTK